MPGSNRVVVHDLVENLGGQPSEMEMLYHCNVGPPFLEAGARIVVPIREMSPLTPRTAEGIDTFDTYLGPTPGYAEQVYCYKPVADTNGRTLALLYNAAADRGFALRWQMNQLPCFTVWKNTSAVEDGYVTGLEPATNYPNARMVERGHGRVHILPPGGSWEASWSMEVLDQREGVSQVLAEVAALQATARAQVHRTPVPPFVPATHGH